MTTVWSALKWGWQPVYWLTIEGIPVVFSEYATGAAVPAGYSSEDASLIIDDSAAVGANLDRFEGVGKSLPLTFRLQDTSTVRSYLKRWSNETYITQDHSSSVTTLTVADTTGFSSPIFIGNERVTYSGSTATTFTGCTRGTVGYAYPHDEGSLGGLVTDLPRYWRGREVKLYATAVDPTGHLPGNVLIDDAELIWRGHIHEGPQRSGLQFEFTALALDRRLSRKIGQKWHGIVADKHNRYRVSPKDYIQAHIIVYDATNTGTFDQVIKWFPFKTKSDGDLLTGSEMRALIKSEYESVVSTLGHGGTLTSIHFEGNYAPGAPNKPGFWRYIAHFTFAADATADRVYVSISPFGPFPKRSVTVNVTSLSAGDRIESVWWTQDNPKESANAGSGHPDAALTMAVLLKQGHVSDVPSTGFIKVGTDNPEIYEYGKVETVGGLAYLSQINISMKSTYADWMTTKPGAQVEIVSHMGAAASPVAPASAVARTLSSSGEANLRNATYDVEDRGAGYALDDDQADYSQIVDHLTNGTLSSLRVVVAPDGQTFADVYGGLLSLAGMAIVMRPDESDGRKAKLMAVNTAYGGGYATTISDTDLLTMGAEPVHVEPHRIKPNSATVTAEQLGETLLSMSFEDYPAIQAQGREHMDFALPVAMTDELEVALGAWAIGILGMSEISQLVTISVPPWIDAEAGDMVKLNVTHPALWDWANGTPGYVGGARVIGRETRLENGVTTLRLVINGETNEGALCPSALVDAFAGTAGAPTTIDVDIKYLSHFTDAISAAGGNIRVLHYRPGQAEGVADGYDISAAAASGGKCRLTVAAVNGTPSLTVTTPDAYDDSHITLPESANDDAFQALFMHKSDGSKFV